jgi:hypothetical protein
MTYFGIANFGLGSEDLITTFGQLWRNFHAGERLHGHAFRTTYLAPNAFEVIRPLLHQIGC